MALAHTIPVPQFVAVGLSYFRVRMDTRRLLTGREETTKVTVNKITRCKMLRSSLKDIVRLKLDRQ